MKDDLLQTCILWLCPCTVLRQGSHVLCGMIHGPRKHFPCCPMTAPQVCIPQGELLASGISLELNFLVLFFTPFLHESCMNPTLQAHYHPFEEMPCLPPGLFVSVLCSAYPVSTWKVPAVLQDSAEVKPPSLSSSLEIEGKNLTLVKTLICSNS